MSKMHVVQVTRPNGPFEIVEREIPQPGAGSVRVKVEACGVCHSDSFTKEGTWPGIKYPRVAQDARRFVSDLPKSTNSSAAPG